MKRRRLFGMVAMILAVAGGMPTARAQTVPAAMPLWPAGKVPGATGTRPEDTPTLTPYLPEGMATTPRPAIVICPGGGYGMLADHEGKDYAQFLAAHGIAGFVLKYRLGSNGYHHPAMLQDVSRALRTVRARAKEWNIDPARVGVMGSSAGGHLAATAVTHFDAGHAGDTDPIERESSRPDIGILCYAVISMQKELTHGGSRQNLLGNNPPQSLVDDLSNEKQVTAKTPPCFIWHTDEDTVVKVENAFAFATALRQHGIPFDLHIYQKGAHGIGLADKAPFAHVHPWANDLLFWLRAQNFLPPMAQTP